MFGILAGPSDHRSARVMPNTNIEHKLRLPTDLSERFEEETEHRRGVLVYFY